MSLKKIGKSIKKTNKKVKGSPVTKGMEDAGIEIAESTPPGEIVAASIAESDQEKNKK